MLLKGELSVSKGVDGAFFDKFKFRKIKDESGQNLVEFALVIPIFLTILMGMIDFGWYLKLNHDLVRANSQGARVAAFAATDTSVKQAVVDCSTDALPISADNVNIVRQDPDMIRGTSVEVSSVSVYKSVTGFSIVHLLLNDKPLQATATVRIE